jgi:hypothetical protein
MGIGVHEKCKNGNGHIVALHKDKDPIHPEKSGLMAGSTFNSRDDRSFASMRSKDKVWWPGVRVMCRTRMAAV